MLRILFLGLSLMFRAWAQEVFVCPSSLPGAVDLSEIGSYVLVYNSLSEAQLAVFGLNCKHLSQGPHSYLVRQHQSFAHLDDGAFALSDIGCTATSVPAYKQGSSSDFVVLSCPEDSLEEMHTSLYTHQFQSIQAVAPQNTSSVPRPRANHPKRAGKDRVGKDAFVAEISKAGAKYETYLSDLTGRGVLDIQTRCSYASQHNTAADYILQHFTAQGLDASLQPFRFGRTSTNNVVAVKRGTTRPDEVIVFGGHYDSTSPQCTTNAPGAIDNGGGCVATMLMAEYTKDLSFDRTIHFICFGGEEQGLYGSYHYVGVSDTSKIKAALINDMIAYVGRNFGVTFEGTTNSDILRLLDLAEANSKTFAPTLHTKQNKFSFGSDHVPFQQAGVPAFLYIQMDETDYPCYHQTCDTMDYLNLDLAMGIVAGSAGTLWDCANMIF